MDLDLRLIRHALALAQHGHFMRAARSLHVSQPTLSRNIATLERSLGVRLFDRNPEGVQLTAFGRLLIERGRALLNGEADLLREIQLQAGLEIGNLKVTAGPFPFETSVGDAMARLIERHPRLKVTVTVDHARNVVRDVLAGEVDVGVADLSITSAQPRLQVEPLPEHRIWIACRAGHPLLGKQGRITPSDIAAYPVASTHILGKLSGILATLAATTPRQSGSFDAASGDYYPAIHVNSQFIARRIACGSDALVAGTTMMLQSDVDAGKLVMLDFEVPDLKTGYAILTLKGRTPSPAALEMMDLLRRAEADVVRLESRREATTVTHANRKPRSARRQR